MKVRKVGLIGATPEEIQAYKGKIKGGRWNGKEVFLSISGVGKPAAAASTQKIICDKNPDIIIFSGVCGSLDKETNQGDIGIAIGAIDSDMDVRVWSEYPRKGKKPYKYKLGEQPYSHERIYESDPLLVRLALEASSDFKKFKAYIASGSKFIDERLKKEFIKQVLPHLFARVGGKDMYPNVFDMESSAVLQTANTNKVPVLVIRAVSDNLEGNVPQQYNEFIKDAVEHYVDIVDYILKKI